MKSSSPALFELIKSLTSSEKRYLKLGISGKQPEHLKLFDAIVRLENYDEAVLKKQNEGSRFAQNLPIYKTYLYQYILNRLAQFYENSESAEVFECIRFAEVLVEKKLIDQAAKQLRKGEKLAAKYDLPDMYLLVSKMQREILSQSTKMSFERNEALYRLRQQALDELALNNEYSRLFSEISSLQIKIQKANSPEDIEALEQWKQQTLLTKQETDLSVPNRILLLKSMAIYHFTRNEPDKASDYNKKILNLLEKESWFNKKHPEQYLSALNNYIIDQLTLMNIPAFEEGLKRLEQVPDNPAFAKIKNIKSRMFHQRYLLYFNYCYSAKDYNRAMAEMAEFEKGLQNFEGQLKFHQKLTLHYLAGVLSFGAGQYLEAQNWLFPILQETKAEIVPEVFRHARILNLLVHFELGNFEYLESLLLSTQRLLMKRGSMSSTEKALWQFLKKTTAFPNRRTLSKEAEILRIKYETIGTQAEGRRLFEYIPLMEWLTRLIN
ncbi:MAG: hypothetical protein DWQ02_15345 [Bacteroidetes bacterium]|nr:MAG: hypothetical protein DWQ02_15345 [Bacteroidota bacterium]